MAFRKALHKLKDKIASHDASPGSSAHADAEKNSQQERDAARQTLSSENEETVSKNKPLKKP